MWYFHNAFKINYFTYIWRKIDFSHACLCLISSQSNFGYQDYGFSIMSSRIRLAVNLLMSGDYNTEDSEGGKMLPNLSLVDFSKIHSMIKSVVLEPGGVA